MAKSSDQTRWVLGISGASGVVYAQRLMECLDGLVAEVHVIISEAGYRVWHDELGTALSPSSLSAEKLIGKSSDKFRFYHYSDIGALPASGSACLDGMVLVPCSMSTLGCVANGCGSNLVQRAADVALKEARPLIVVPRETPLSAIHLENMLRLSRAGARIVPAMPSFYQTPKGIDELVDIMVMKILDQMGLENNLAKRWKGGC